MRSTVTPLQQLQNIGFYLAESVREHYQMELGSGLLNKQLFKVSGRSHNVVSEVICAKEVGVL